MLGANESCEIEQCVYWSSTKSLDSFKSSCITVEAASAVASCVSVFKALASDKTAVRNLQKSVQSKSRNRSVDLEDDVVSVPTKRGSLDPQRIRSANCCWSSLAKTTSRRCRDGFARTFHSSRPQQRSARESSCRDYRRWYHW